MRLAAETFRRGCPDWHSDLHQLVAEGDLVVERFTASGTHRGELMGVPPTGREVTVTGIALYRIVDGKITEAIVEENIYGMMQQLGVIPGPGRPAS
jgi:predicted ester cyclase